MRRHRRIRTGYRSGTKKKSIKAIVIRILFVIVCAAVLTFASVLLGTYLKGKAEEAENILSSQQETPLPPQGAEVFPDGVPSDSEADALSVCAAYIDLTDGGAIDITDMISELPDIYNTVSVDIFDENGQLIYISKALMNYVGLNTDNLSGVGSSQTVGSLENDDADTEGNTEINIDENINALINQCDRRSLRLSALFPADVAVLEDSNEAYIQRDIGSVIIGELYSMGFDEIIITGLVENDETISQDKLKNIVSYLAHLRKNSDALDIGLLLPSSVYMTPQSAATIKTLSEYADFLAISIDTEATDQNEAYYSVYDDCHSLKGNFSVYNIRGVITSLDPDISSAIYAALRDLSVASTQFSVYVDSPDFAPDHQGDVDSSTQEEPVYNENASRSENYETSADDETTPIEDEQNW